MKPTSSPRMILMASLGTAMLAISSAAAQTLFYSDAGSGSNAFAGGVISDGTLASIGLDVSQYNEDTGAIGNDTGLATTRVRAGIAAAPLALNFIASNLTAPVGTELSSVTLYLYADSINPNGTTQNYTLYDGLNATGSAIGVVPVTQSTTEGTFFAITVTGQQFLNGFSLNSVGLLPATLMNVGTEMSNTPSTVIRSPGLSATFVAIPEPTSFALAAFGSLALLRRRRA